MYIKFITKPGFNTPPLAAGMVYFKEIGKKSDLQATI
jgi:hypothetical protein